MLKAKLHIESRGELPESIKKLAEAWESVTNLQLEAMQTLDVNDDMYHLMLDMPLISMANIYGPLIYYTAETPQKRLRQRKHVVRKVDDGISKAVIQLATDYQFEQQRQHRKPS